MAHNFRRTSYADVLRIALAGKREPDTSRRLAAIDHLRQRLADEEQAIAHGMRLRGATWADIGNVWGITRQAAQQRFHVATLLDHVDQELGRTPKG